MQTLVIDAQNFLAGMSTNKFFGDAGYSPLSKGVNHIYEKGVLHFQPKATAITYSGGGNLIAALANEVNTSFIAFFVDSAKNFASLNSDFTTTIQGTDVSANTYVYGQSSATIFANQFFITTHNDLVKWNINASVPTTIDYSYWKTTLSHSNFISSVKHPLQAIEDTLYIGDGQFIDTIDSTLSSVQHAMVLPLSTEITAFAAHPNGRDLLAFCTREGNSGDTKGVKNVAYIINTVTLEFSNEIVIDDMVASARTVAGITYVTYGTKLGYFTDTGIVFLRQLDLSYGADSGLIFRSRTANMAGTYLAVEGNSILALGDLGAGKAFYYPLSDTTNTNSAINGICPIGQDRILYGKDTGLLYYVDYKTDTDNADSKLFYTNKITLPARAWVRRVEIEHTPYVTGVGLKLYSVDESDNLSALGTFSYATSSTASFSRWDMNVHTSLIQFAIGAIKSAGSPIGIRKMTIYYEISDEI